MHGRMNDFVFLLFNFFFDSGRTFEFASFKLFESLRKSLIFFFQTFRTRPPKSSSDEHGQRPPSVRCGAAAAVEHSVFRSESGSDGAFASVWQCEQLSAIRQHASDQPALFDLIERIAAIVQFSVFSDDNRRCISSVRSTSQSRLHHCATAQSWPPDRCSADKRATFGQWLAGHSGSVRVSAVATRNRFR